MMAVGKPLRAPRTTPLPSLAVGAYKKSPRLVPGGGGAYLATGAGEGNQLAVAGVLAYIDGEAIR